MAIITSGVGQITVFLFIRRHCSAGEVLSDGLASGKGVGAKFPPDGGDPRAALRRCDVLLLPENVQGALLLVSKLNRGCIAIFCPRFFSKEGLSVHFSSYSTRESQP
jgi:hypothetical protein